MPVCENSLAWWWTLPWGCPVRSCWSCLTSTTKAESTGVVRSSDLGDVMTKSSAADKQGCVATWLPNTNQQSKCQHTLLFWNIVITDFFDQWLCCKVYDADFLCMAPYGSATFQLYHMTIPVHHVNMLLGKTAQLRERSINVLSTEPWRQKYHTYSVHNTFGTFTD